MADKQVLKQVRLQRRKWSVRNHVLGVPERPRLSIYRSGKHIYAQVIDDLAGKTLASVGTTSEGILGGEKSGANVAAAKLVGKAIAERAKAVGVSKVVFDRGGRRYHGRIKALADSAREGGLLF